MLQYIVFSSLISVSTLLYLRRRSKNRTKKLVYIDETKKDKIVRFQHHPARMWLRDLN
jgi:hypothetical protein